MGKGGSEQRARTSFPGDLPGSGGFAGIRGNCRVSSRPMILFEAVLKQVALRPPLLRSEQGTCLCSEQRTCLSSEQRTCLSSEQRTCLRSKHKRMDGHSSPKLTKYFLGGWVGVNWDSLVEHQWVFCDGYFSKMSLIWTRKKVDFWRCCSGRESLSEACTSILPQLFLRNLPYKAKIWKIRKYELLIFFGLIFLFAL